MKPLRKGVRQTGSSLLAVFWVISILSLAVMTCVSFVLSDVQYGVSGNLGFEARQMAEKGIAIAANPIVNPWDEVLQYQDENGSGYQVSVVSEGALFNLNSIIAGQDEDLLQRIFGAWGLDLEAAQNLSDAMFDWVDPDGLERLNGAEEEYYRELGFLNLPYNRPFRSLDEAAMVAGMRDLEAAFPRWREFFTLWSSGRLDVNEAQSGLIALACQCPQEAAENWITIRRGADGLENTEDDVRISSMAELIAMISPEPGAEAYLNRRIGFGDSAARIISSGFSGDRTYRRSIVLRRDISQPKLLFIKDETF